MKDKKKVRSSPSICKCECSPTLCIRDYVCTCQAYGVKSQCEVFLQVQVSVSLSITSSTLHYTTYYIVVNPARGFVSGRFIRINSNRAGTLNLCGISIKYVFPSFTHLNPVMSIALLAPLLTPLLFGTFWDEGGTFGRVLLSNSTKITYLHCFTLKLSKAP